MNNYDKTLFGEHEERIEAFEAELAGGRLVRLGDFLPDHHHPDYVATLQELVRIKMEHRFASGGTASLEEYRADFPELFDDPEVLAPLAWEEFRLRRQARQAVEPAEYADRYGVSTSDWPSGGDMDKLTGPEPEPLSAGETLLDFLIIGQLGRGAFSRVYLARQKSLANRLVVLKLSSARLPEADRLARLQHTNIVPIYSVHQSGAATVLCMPYFGATTLKHVIDALPHRPEPASTGNELISTVTALDSKTLTSFNLPRRTVTEPVLNGTESSANAAETPRAISPLAGLDHEHASLWIVRQMTEGLCQAHARGILHRDLKPANVLLTEDGQPMILDFNLSFEQNSASTQEMLVGGTLPYMSPEQISSIETLREVDARSDIFSLGVILFELLTGTLPFSAKGTDLKSMIEDRWSQVLDLRSIHRHISIDTESIVRHCLAPAPESRYQSAVALIEDLDRQLHNLPLLHAANRSWRQRSLKWVRRHPRITSASGILTLSLAAVVASMAMWMNMERRFRISQAQQWYGEYNDRLPQVRSEAFVTALGDVPTETVVVDLNQMLERYHAKTRSDWMQTSEVIDLRADQRQELMQSIAELKSLLAFVEEKQSGNTAHGNSSTMLPDAAALADADWTSYQAALTAVMKHEFNTAEQSLRLLVQRHPDNFAEAFLCGLALRGKLNPEQAEDLFSACIALKPEATQPWYQRGICRLAIKDFSGAAEDFSRVLEIEPNYTNALVSRALAYRDLENLTPALADLNLAILRQFPETRVYFIRAEIHQRLGNVAEAEQDRQTGLNLIPQDARSWVARGLQKLTLDPAAALQDFESAQQLEPNSQDAFRNMAMVLSEHLSRPDDSLKVLNEAIGVHPLDAYLWSGRAVLHARAGRRDAALHDVAEALKLSNEPLLVYQVACVYALTSKIVAEDKQEAMSLLASSFRANANIARLAWTDKDMDPIREDIEFKRLVSASEILAPKKAAVATE